MDKKIRQSNVMKNPITLIIGDNERDNNLISYRKYGSEETYSMSIDEFIEFIKQENWNIFDECYKENIYLYEI
mgnify:CR=1 FL=1